MNCVWYSSQTLITRGKKKKKWNLLGLMFNKWYLAVSSSNWGGVTKYYIWSNECKHPLGRSALGALNFKVIRGYSLYVLYCIQFSQGLLLRRVSDYSGGYSTGGGNYYQLISASKVQFLRVLKGNSFLDFYFVWPRVLNFDTLFFTQRILLSYFLGEFIYAVIQKLIIWKLIEVTQKI